MESTSVRNEKPTDAITENFCMDYVSEMKVPDYIILPDKTFPLKDIWRSEWERGVQIQLDPDRKKVFHVQEYEPKPKYCRSHSSKNRRDFSLPRSLLNAGSQSESWNTHSKNSSFYDLDVLDHHWLENLNNEMRVISNHACAVTESLLENAIEFLEATSHQRMTTFVGDDVTGGLGIEYDAETQCAVCQSMDSATDNEILFCDGCDLAVHQGCYGIIDVPSGRWFCSLCLANLSQDPPKCELCPVIGGGAMKRVKGSATQWCHVVCCLWLPETCFQDPYRMDVVVNVENVSKVRRTLICVVCRTRNGACVQCSNSSCITSYHVTCAMKSKYEVSADYLNEDDNEVEFLTFCKKHTLENIERRSKNASDENSSFSSLAIGGKRTPRRTRNSHKSREEVELIKTGANFTPRKVRLERITNKFYTFVGADDLAEKFKAPKYLLEAIYEYWKLKRKSMNNQPLLLITDEQCKDYRSSRPVVKSNTLFLTGSYIDLRRDMEKLRNLVHMSYRREKLKKIAYSTEVEAFQLELAAHELNIKLKKEQSVEKSDSDSNSEVMQLHKPGIYSRSEFLFYDKFLPRRSTSRRSLIVDENQNKIHENVLEKSEKDYYTKDANVIPAQRQQFRPSRTVEDTKSLNLKDLVDKLLAASVYTDQRTEIPPVPAAVKTQPDPKPDIPISNLRSPDNVGTKERSDTTKDLVDEPRRAKRSSAIRAINFGDLKTEKKQENEVSNLPSFLRTGNADSCTQTTVSENKAVEAKLSHISSLGNKRKFQETRSLDSLDVSKENASHDDVRVCNYYTTTSDLNANIQNPRVTRSAVGSKKTNIEESDCKEKSQGIPFGKESFKINLKTGKASDASVKDEIYDQLLPVISKEVELKPVMKRARFAPNVEEKIFNSVSEIDMKSPLHDVQNSKPMKRSLRSSSKSTEGTDCSSEGGSELSFAGSQSEKKPNGHRKQFVGASADSSTVHSPASSIAASQVSSRLRRTTANQKLIRSK